VASLHQKYYGSWHHELSAKDLVRYLSIAVIAVLGIAGLLQNIAGSSTIETAPTPSSYGSGVYTSK
jgi:hypothetical protein